MMAAIGVFDGVINHVEAMAIQQGSILGRVETGVIEGLALELTDCFSAGRPGREHERRTACGVLFEDGEHPALIIGRQMKRAVPGQNAVIAKIKLQVAHVRDNPAGPGDPLTGDVDQFGR